MNERGNSALFAKPVTQGGFPSAPCFLFFPHPYIWSLKKPRHLYLQNSLRIDLSPHPNCYHPGPSCPTPLLDCCDNPCPPPPCPCCSTQRDPVKTEARSYPSMSPPSAENKEKSTHPVPGTSQASWPDSLLNPYFTPVTLISLPVPEHAKHSLAPGPLHVLFPGIF